MKWASTAAVVVAFVAVVVAALGALGYHSHFLEMWQHQTKHKTVGQGKAPVLSPSLSGGGAVSVGTVGGSWDETTIPLAEHVVSDVCTLDVVDAAEVSRKDFERVYLERKPVVLRSATNVTKFAELVQKGPLLRSWGDHLVTLSTANKNSYAKREELLSEYVGSMMRPTTLDAQGDSSWYHFGDNKHQEWSALFDLYEKPTKYIFGKYASLSFGLGGSGSGVPFHTHGHVFAEVFYGRKRWFIQEPGPEPLFDPNATSLSWVVGTYPELSAANRTKILDCTLGVGEMLYIPTLWHHATLNIGETVFMSTFV